MGETCTLTFTLTFDYLDPKSIQNSGASVYKFGDAWLHHFSLIMWKDMVSDRLLVPLSTAWA